MVVLRELPLPCNVRWRSVNHQLSLAPRLSALTEADSTPIIRPKCLLRGYKANDLSGVPHKRRCFLVFFGGVMPVCDPKLEPNAPGLIIFGRLHRVHRLIDGGLRDSLLDLPLVEGQRMFLIGVLHVFQGEPEGG